MSEQFVSSLVIGCMVAGGILGYIFCMLRNLMDMTEMRRKVMEADKLRDETNRALLTALAKLEEHENPGTKLMKNGPVIRKRGTPVKNEGTDND
ncbi:hypothetical protein SEA_KABOCHA_13 [Gordonia phage Kabocha]|uniref:Uncharacterized protein n=1 Tax=Gordonia phage Chidiebere TaxID=2656530 RepID=A0A649VL86_9CAUD|nr:hypothetical protein PQD14_gp013 [Gordonia phage Chidiebere]QGJ92905.1 hypothetical protein PBI_CHIDIEBERE_13 [Gordonia phage Chidiebere]WAA19800.1 hypothetical protein SEA_KABOCHA_13 [Gordonia phage Kabocha]WAA19991.1 hypothetical protein SEA_HANEM_13 [Gordonia phage Hanem]